MDVLKSPTGLFCKIVYILNLCGCLLMLLVTFIHPLNVLWASLVSHLQWGRPGFNPWVGKIPWRRESLPIPVFWPRKFHGLYGSWGCKELDTTEWLSLSQATIALFCLLNTILHPQSIFPAVLSVVPAFWVLYKWFRLILQILAQKSPSQRGFP